MLTNIRIADNVDSRRALFSARQAVIDFDPLRLLAFPGKPVSSVRRVLLDHPVLSFSRHADGVTNIDDFFTKKPASGDKFRGEIIVNEGDISYRDARGWAKKPCPLNAHLVHVNVHLLKESDSYLPFHLTAMSTTGEARHLDITGGIHVDSRTIGCEVDYRDVDLAFVQRVIPVSLPLSLQAGHVDGRWQLDLQRDPRLGKLNWRITLAADVRDAHGMLKLFHTVPYTITRAHLRLADKVLQIDDARGIIAGVPVQVSGSITNFTGAIYALQVQSSGADTATIIRQIPGLARLPYTWGGKTEIWAQLTGALKAVQVIGHLRGSALSAGFGHYTNLCGDFCYTENVVHFSNFTGEAFGGQFAGSLWVALQSRASHALFMQGQAAHVDLHQVIASFVTPASATVSPGVSCSLREVRGAYSGPVTLQLAADGQVTVLLNGHIPLQIPTIARGDVYANLQLDVLKQGFVAHIFRAETLLPEGHFQAWGRVSSTDGVRLALRGDALNLHLLGVRAHRADLSGTGYVRGELTGPLAQPVFAGSVLAKDGSMAGHAFNDFTSEVSASLGASPSIRLQKLLLLANGSRWQLDGLTLTNFGNTQWAPSGTLLLQPAMLASLQDLWARISPCMVWWKGRSISTVTANIRKEPCCCAIPGWNWAICPYRWIAPPCTLPWAPVS